MYLQLKEIKWIPFCVIAAFVTRVGVTLHVFPSLMLFSYLALGLTILSFFFYLMLYLKEKRMTTFAMAYVLFFAFLFAMSVINDAEYLMAFYVAVEVLLLLLLFAYYQKNLKFIVQTFAFFFSLIIYINLAIMILFPAWMFQAKDIYDSFLLGGNYNQMGARLICGLVVSVLCIHYSKWWILNSIILFLVCVTTLLLVGSMNSTANIIVYGLFCLIPSLTLRKAAIVSLFVVFILFHVFVVFNGESIHHNELAVYIIEDVLGKDITFTNRTFLWEGSMRLFSESPIVGHGVGGADWYRANLSAMALGPHNFLLSILIHGGIVLFAMYCLICWMAFKKIIENFDFGASVILMGIAVIMFMMTMEVYSIFFISFFLTFAYYYKDIRESFPQKSGNKPSGFTKK